MFHLMTQEMDVNCMVYREFANSDTCIQLKEDDEEKLKENKSTLSYFTVSFSISRKLISNSQNKFSYLISRN